MAQLGFTINRNELPNNEGNFDPITAGKYDAQITKAEVKPTKDGTGMLLAIGYTILGPTHQNRIVFGNLNIKNKSEVAERIGRGQLGDLLTAIELESLSDSDQLINKILTIKIKVRPAVMEKVNGVEVEKYPATNDVVGWSVKKGVILPKAPAGSSSAPSAPWGAPKSTAPAAPWQTGLTTADAVPEWVKK